MSVSSSATSSVSTASFDLLAPAAQGHHRPRSQCRHGQDLRHRRTRDAFRRRGCGRPVATAARHVQPCRHPGTARTHPEAVRGGGDRLSRTRTLRAGAHDPLVRYLAARRRHDRRGASASGAVGLRRRHHRDHPRILSADARRTRYRRGTRARRHGWSRTSTTSPPRWSTICTCGATGGARRRSAIAEAKTAARAAIFDPPRRISLPRAPTALPRASGWTSRGEVRERGRTTANGVWALRDFDDQLASRCTAFCSTPSTARRRVAVCATASVSCWSTSSRTPTPCSGRFCGGPSTGTAGWCWSATRSRRSMRSAARRCSVTSTRSSLVGRALRADHQLAQRRRPGGTRCEHVYGGAALGDPRIVANRVDAAQPGSRMTGLAPIRLRHLPRAGAGPLNDWGFPRNLDGLRGACRPGRRGRHRQDPRQRRRHSRSRRWSGSVSSRVTSRCCCASTSR